ncbi:hypothetical protein DFR29_115104 [Tahibacter aquaticus]|jgi:hypothetical protein|uniref:Uncharacterized protein n=1 Tax=Tahibacter aquaticus TaxID=520092 RepID=A0A4R6YPW7_9GAMM|nr:hypothetical protein [Tahibacter aquaticus]TDR39714.1 hypothetical protein DFR29_115104 [Tahibacter aquaticus]
MTDSSFVTLQQELQQLTTRTLSPSARYGHVALLLASALMCAVLASLLATETALPGRTQLAFAVLLVIGTSWLAYALWVLRSRHSLLANQRIVAGRMAVAFTSVFVAGALLLGAVTGRALFPVAAAFGGSLLVLACLALQQAHRRADALRARRSELERMIGAQS